MRKWLISFRMEMQKASQFDWLFLVERSIELSNLDDIYDISRQRMIWEGLGEIKSLIKDVP